MKMGYRNAISGLLIFMIVYINCEGDQNNINLDVGEVSYQDSVVTLNDFNISVQELISITKWGRNPFLPYYSLSGDNILISEFINDLNCPELMKIYFDRNQRKAIINNKIVKVNDFFLDMRIQYIGQSLVLLHKNESPYMLLKLGR